MPKSSLTLVAAAALLLVAPLGAWAQVQAAVVSVQSEELEIGDAAAEDIDLDDLLWVARPLVVFADTSADPRFSQQMQMIEAGIDVLTDRRVVVLTDTDPDANGPLRTALRPRGFGLVLIDTDGTVIQRRPSPTSVRELSGTIDRLPSRREETGSRRP